MTHPAVDHLPEKATSTLLRICERLSRSQLPGLAQWAASTSDALLVQLASVTSGARIDVVDFQACGPLAQLETAELEELRVVVLAVATNSDDASVVEWCTRMDRLINADFWRREYEQAVFDAKAAAMEAEERSLACKARTAPNLRGVSP
jgi:hypothetical protein